MNNSDRTGSEGWVRKPPKIIVLDDDPTGSQTVHSCLLLLRWDVMTLKLGLLDSSPIFFILTNTRSRLASEAARVTRDVCCNLRQALAETQTQQVLLVSRSDSTLRGHYPLETDVIAQELGPFDAHFLVPAFLEGGRITRESTHYIQTVTETGAVQTPVHQTEFAQDPMFPFSASYLPDYVAEKTQGQILADQVVRLTTSELEGSDVLQEKRRSQLLNLQQNCCVVVDAESQSHLDRFAADIVATASQGKRFLFRSAASLLTSLAQLPPQPLKAEAMGQLNPSRRPGVVLVGSYVQKTTQQLMELLQAPEVTGIEINLARLRQDLSQMKNIEAEVLAQIQQQFERGQTSVVYTSREEQRFESSEARLQFGRTVSELLVAIARGLPQEIGFLISKGGITSNDTLSRALNLNQVRLLGQILPGVCVVKTEQEHPRFSELPVILFPGNVGERESLAIAYDRMRGEMKRHSLSQINQLEQTAFVTLLGPIFEGTPAIAAAIWPQQPFESQADLYRALADEMRSLSPEQQLSLIKAHPDLGAKAKMAPASVEEQSSVGLDQLTPEEFKIFQNLNHSYRETFGFPFIIAVKHHTKASVLDAFRLRLKNSQSVEQAIALDQIAEIARLRLNALIAGIDK